MLKGNTPCTICFEENHKEGYKMFTTDLTNAWDSRVREILNED